MEQVVDRLIAEMDELIREEEFMQAMTPGTDTKFDDPGLVTIDEYPYLYVAPMLDEPLSETTGYDVRLLTIQIGVVVNASDYFDPTVNELPASRELVRASSLIRKRLRRTSKRGLQLDG